MKDEKILQEEKLSDEQLENVVGGSMDQTNKDFIFFEALGVKFKHGENISPVYQLAGEFCKCGIDFGNDWSGDNSYKFQGAYSYAKHPRHAALGYVLNKMNYPGYSGKWWDLNYTRDFIREHIGSNVL